MSIVKIAEIAGVGIGTVSRYINDRSKVSDSAARKIARAIEETGYQPRIRRPGPKTRERQGIKTGVVLYLTLGEMEPERMLGMPAFPMLLTGIQKALMAQGMSLMFASSRTGEDMPEMLDEKFCDGVIVQSFTLGGVSDRLRKKLKSMPVVWCMRDHCDFHNDFDHVFYNNGIIGVLAARYMASKGHKKVAYFSSSREHVAFSQRLDSFTRNGKILGLDVECFISEFPENELIVKHSKQLADKFEKSSKDFTGIFFCSDDAMLGVYNELRSRGFSFDDIELLGCNNEEQFLAHICPRPATIDIRLREMGEQTVSRLMSRINGTETGPAMELLINPQLIPAEK